jgi:hypothetical protein
MPFHNFIVGDEQLALDDVSWSEHGVVIHGHIASPQASIDDEIISYFNDSLVWIKSEGPSDSFSGYGLDRYGYTSIKEIEGLVAFKNIITSWINLFNNAPIQ